VTMKWVYCVLLFQFTGEREGEGEGEERDLEPQFVWNTCK